MGCSICMDDFDEAEDSQRPTALPCGHIFHYGCAQSWFFGPASTSTSTPNNKRCPLCAKPTKVGAMIRLYPSEGNDLDRYLEAKHWTQQEEVATALAAATSSSGRNEVRSRDILNSLMELNTSLQAFVMAAHNVQIETTSKAGAKVTKLVQSMRPDAGQASLQRAIDSLDKATHLCYETACETKEKKIKISEKLEAVKAVQVRAETALRNAVSREAAANLLAAEETRKLAEVEKARTANKMLQQDLERRAMQLDVADADLRQRHRALEQERQQAAVNTSMKIGMIENKTKEELSAMQVKVMMAERKCKEAEQERHVTKEKSNTLAEQMREMKERIAKLSKTNVILPTSSVTPAPSNLNSSVGSAATIRKQAAEIRTLKQLVKKLQDDAQQTPQKSQPPKRRTDFYDLTRSSSPPSDTEVQTTATGPCKKQKRQGSLLVEAENLDDEVDDDLYPMPGLVTSVRPALKAAHINTPPVISSTRNEFLEKFSNKAGVVLGSKRRPQPF